LGVAQYVASRRRSRAAPTPTASPKIFLRKPSASRTSGEERGLTAEPQRPQRPEGAEIWGLLNTSRHVVDHAQLRRPTPPPKPSSEKPSASRTVERRGEGRGLTAEPQRPEGAEIWGLLNTSRHVLDHAQLRRPTRPQNLPQISAASAARRFKFGECSCAVISECPRGDRVFRVGTRCAGNGDRLRGAMLGRGRPLFRTSRCRGGG